MAQLQHLLPPLVPLRGRRCGIGQTDVATGELGGQLREDVIHQGGRDVLVSF
ncbi:hypothetical protein SFR_6990 (plasmid) [Streptomyces sp. FR-008]|nr:hypothetical protein SFR_6990 [Streptomyces sp. FR-008]